MNNDPQAIKREIEHTRSHITDTIEALAYKTDVRARTKDAINERIETVKGTISDAITIARSAVSNATDALPPRDEMAERVQQMRTKVESNPGSLAFGSLAIGVLIGLLLP